jgi:hypothetical protein
MFKRTLILALFSYFLLRVEAQDSFKPSTHVGFHGGINLSAVSFFPKVEQELLTSRALGIVFRHISEPHIGLQIEANLSGKGWKEIIDSVGSYTRRLETVDVPIMAVFIAGSKLVQFAFTIGPYVSYLRHEKETINIADTAYFLDYYHIPLQNDWEFGFTGGIGIEFHTKIGAFGLKASYNHSLTNIFPLNTDVHYFYGSRNQVINAGLFYLIKL